MVMPQEIPVSPYANTILLSFAEAERKSCVLFPIENNFRISGARSDLIYKRYRWDADEEKRWWGVSPEQVSVPPPGMLPRRVLISVGPADERRTGTTQLVAHASRHSITPLRSYSFFTVQTPCSSHATSTPQDYLLERKERTLLK